MSIISKESAQAFWAGRGYKKNNTAVLSGCLDNGKPEMLLWGNKIAWQDLQGNLCFCLCGWDSKTTCERLRALGLPIWHKRGGLYCGDDLIESRGQYVYLQGKAQKIN